MVVMVGANDGGRRKKASGGRRLSQFIGHLLITVLASASPYTLYYCGSLFLFDRKVLRYFGKDGHN
ncbi:hypothetical protein CsSME_00007615 [Camellia sinensis var. sinensis]